ncbi:hypothetical protein [Spiroplasma endosymbiont of Aleiodes alternator]|uniref:hypothetical protein n=1 Tax=Spiroplasma endosymbiont of Aleiodes alternator TaxID=3139329 RepID=UPI003CCAADCB
MRNMKTLLRLMGGAALTTVAASSVVACGTQTKAPALNGKYATLLGWYSDENTSTINQELKKDDTAGKESYSIAVSAADNTKITTTKFNEKLLKAGTGTDSDKSQAVSDDSAAFLKDLGFTPDSKKFYSAGDVKKITALSAKVESTEAGKVEAAGTTDFKFEAGTCQINIMYKATGDDAKSVKKYTINTLKKDALNISTEVIGTDKLITDKDSLELTDAQGFKRTKPVSSFKLKIKNAVKQKQFDSLVKLLKINVTTKFFDNASAGTEVTGNFPNSKVYLQISFGSVVLSSRIDCDTAPA